MAPPQTTQMLTQVFGDLSALSIWPKPKYPGHGGPWETRPHSVALDERQVPCHELNTHNLDRAQTGSLRTVLRDIFKAYAGGETIAGLPVCLDAAKAPWAADRIVIPDPVIEALAKQGKRIPIMNAVQSYYTRGHANVAHANAAADLLNERSGYPDWRPQGPDTLILRIPRLATSADEFDFAQEEKAMRTALAANPPASPYQLTFVLNPAVDRNDRPTAYIRLKTTNAPRLTTAAEHLSSGAPGQALRSAVRSLVLKSDAFCIGSEVVENILQRRTAEYQKHTETTYPSARARAQALLALPQNPAIPALLLTLNERGGRTSVREVLDNPADFSPAGRAALLKAIPCLKDTRAPTLVAWPRPKAS
jgi:hypothetical protein